MAYLVTGGAGFIGSYVAERLLARGETVIALDNFNPYYDPKLKWQNIERLRSYERFHLVEGDIRSEETVTEVFDAYAITHVAHMAAMAGARGSIENAPLYMSINLTGTLNLLEAARRHDVQQFVQASTSTVYGLTPQVPFTETDAADRPLAPYPASKRAAELLAHTYHHLAGMNIIVARLFNVYGPSGRPDMMPLRLMTAAFSGETVKIFNNGDIYRDWTYIDDTAEGIVSALDRPMGYEIINIGCGEPISLREFIAIIEEYAGRPIARVNEPTPPSDPPITFCNNEKARRLLGFNPRTNIRDGLRHTWEWFYEWYTQKVSP